MRISNYQIIRLEHHKIYNEPVPSAKDIHLNASVSLQMKDHGHLFSQQELKTFQVPFQLIPPFLERQTPGIACFNIFPKKVITATTIKIVKN